MRTASPTPTHRFAAVLPLLMLAPLAAAAQGETHTYIPERGVQSFAVREPVVRLAPGDTLISETMNGAFLPEGSGTGPGKSGRSTSKDPSGATPWSFGWSGWNSTATGRIRGPPPDSRRSP